MSEWKINEEQAQKIIDTPPVKLPITEEKKRDIELARKIIKTWKEAAE